MKHHEPEKTQIDKVKIETMRGELRALQDFLEERAINEVAQVAFSADGRTFGYEAPLSLTIPVGSYVHLKDGKEREYLGQIITKEIIQREGTEISFGIDEQQQDALPEWLNVTETSNRIRIRALIGSGVLLAKLAGDSYLPTSNADTFQKANIGQADSTMVERYLSDTGHKKATLPIGKALYVDGQASVELNASGFNRHTFMCGQSGSGKTFSMGIVMEQILLNTNLRIVIIDPNSDFVSLHRMSPFEQINRFRSEPLSENAYQQLNQRYQQIAAGLRVFRPPVLAENPANALRVRFGDLSQQEQGTVLEMDPLHDREEFNAFWRLIDGLGHQDYSWEDVRNAIGRTLTSENRQLGLRIENLGITDWDVWCAPGEPSVIETLAEDDWRCLVFDIGPLGSRVEKAVIANAVLNYFWRTRNQRQPVLLVIDEAHNICPQEPVDEMQAISTDEVIHIAGEGRKFGLYLLLATQRPSKIHSNVLSQCDNLMLMRMNSASDLTHLASVLSHIPSSLLEQATKFGMGETLLAGRIVKNATFARFEGRLSKEGGSDIPTTWANSGG